MDKNKIDKAVARKLKSYGYSAEDLTEEEMKELREECEIELGGGIVLDGVLFNPEIGMRRIRREFERKLKEKQS
jgi:hypothetical protein